MPIEVVFSEQSRLSPREEVVVIRKCQGLSYAQIAAAMGIGEGTVGTHIHMIHNKLAGETGHRPRNFCEALSLLHRQGWVSFNDVEVTVEVES